VRNISARFIVEGREFVADGAQVKFGETVLPTEAIDAVGYGSWNRQYGIRRNSCVLTAGSAKVDFSFEVHPADPTGNMALWWALMQFLDAQVLSRIAGEHASRIARDESFVFDRLHADRHALTRRGRIRRVTFPWSQIRTVSRGHEHVFISGSDASGHAGKLRVSTWAPNAVALPFLVDLMQRGTGGMEPPGQQQFWRFL
jgi:hypothetical protein